MTVSKKALAKYLDVDPGQIVGMHENPDRVVVVVDKGIAGSPKYTIPMSDLNKPAPPPKEPAPVIEPEAPQDEKKKTPIHEAGLPQNALDALYSVGINYVEDLPDDLTSVKGIGEKTAEAIIEALGGDE